MSQSAGELADQFNRWERRHYERHRGGAASCWAALVCSQDIRVDDIALSGDRMMAEVVWGRHARLMLTSRIERG